MTIFIEEISQNDSAERSYIFPLTNYLATFPDIIPNLKRQLSQTLRFHQFFFSTFLNLIKADWLERKNERSEPEALGPYPLSSQVFLHWLSTIE